MGTTSIKMDNHLSQPQIDPGKTVGIRSRKNAVVDVRNLGKIYGKGERSVEALRDVSLQIELGNIVGILGPNGAGKTTLMEILEGIRSPSSGSIEILGLDVELAGTFDKLRGDMGVAMQHSVLPPLLTVSEVLKLQYCLFDGEKKDPDFLIERMALTDKANSKIKHLSGGQQQRVTVALALVSNPKILFLDEPTSQLDPQARLAVWEMLIEQRDACDTAILLTTHQMEEAQRLCDYVLILDKGQILAEGSPGELVERYCPEQILEFTCSSKIDTDKFSDKHEIREEKVADKQYRVFIKSCDINGVFRLLVETGVLALGNLEDIKVSKQTLEDVFIKITGRGIRD